ncbi:UNVERIFIED_CONTAM: cytochrome [Sesamum calycinum]|uniref:Cytochrome n=1 Tax=Sesamum calycinum TaxID=2727403 RepID=A0AAW2J3J7_9LAMI
MSTLWCTKMELNPWKRTPPLPPGPRGLPILAYLPFLGNNLLHKKAIRDVSSNIGKPVHLGELSFRTELNVIMNMMWGGVVEEEEDQRVGEEFREVVIKLVDLMGKPNLADYFPVLAWFDIQEVKKEMGGLYAVYG